VNVVVMRKLPAGILLGLDFLRKAVATLDWKKGWLTLSLSHESGRFEVRALGMEVGINHLVAVCDEGEEV